VARAPASVPIRKRPRSAGGRARRRRLRRATGPHPRSRVLEGSRQGRAARSRRWPRCGAALGSTRCAARARSARLRRPRSCRARGSLPTAFDHHPRRPLWDGERGVHRNGPPVPRVRAPPAWLRARAPRSPGSRSVPQFPARPRGVAFFPVCHGPRRSASPGRFRPRAVYRSRSLRRARSRPGPSSRASWEANSRSQSQVSRVIPEPRPRQRRRFR